MPELLFNPSDIGINEMGISEAIVDSVESCVNGNYLKQLKFVETFLNKPLHFNHPKTLNNFTHK